MNKILLLLSGGLDSVTMLYFLNKQMKYDVETVGFYYGSKHNKRELQNARYHTKLLNVPFMEIDVSNIFSLFDSSLLKKDKQIPEGYYTDDNMKSTVVPFRNGILLSIVAGLAESKNIKKIAIASHSGDHAIYPDCRPDFNKAIYKAIKFGTYNKIEVLTLFEDFTKEQIVKIGLKLGIDYSKTWSCYKGKNRPCGKCGTCVERTEAFYKNNVPDPLLTTEEWERFVEYYKKFKKEKKYD